MKPSFLALTAVAVYVSSYVAHAVDFPTKSGLLPWVDPATPENRQSYRSSRGDTWELVMSDEFNTPGRSFEPGKDHMWTSIDKPDGVNAALEIYSHNMTTTVCDSPDFCYFQIKIIEDPTTLRLWNDYQTPPGYKTVTFYYRAAMVQSWNKFCFQGGMLEVSAKLPGAVSPSSGNPDLANGDMGRAATRAYYPTWPGIWLLGNLGRAIFSASTNRMWPFSYDECNPEVFEPSNQRISACNGNPGHGLNPYQGRGAPEIDLLEGGGDAISSSIQVGPGMPDEYRLFPAVDDESIFCVYSSSCTTKGANSPDIPASYYKAKRPRYKSWYQDLKYASNNFCAPSASEVQDYKTVKANLDAGVEVNICNKNVCSASKDPNADLSLMDGTNHHWGINSNGTCYPVMNGYTGAYLCSPGNPAKACGDGDAPVNDKVTPFAYQMDAISSNWPVHVGAYTKFLVYQIEWVTGEAGYVRWMLDGNPIFEIPATAINEPPQNAAKSNPKRLMLEEPMYIIFNVALSESWGTTPPNAGKACRGDGKNPEVNRICDSFPMYMKIDYIRLYQDVSTGSNMTVTCDPATHPTKQWIADHIDEYRDFDNPVLEVKGKGFCRTDEDCTVDNAKLTKILTGSCVKNRCECSGQAWGGPRCTSALGSIQAEDSDGVFGSIWTGSYGPPWSAALSLAGISFVLTVIAVWLAIRADKQNEVELKRTMNPPAPKAGGVSTVASPAEPAWNQAPAKNTNYATNFV